MLTPPLPLSSSHSLHDGLYHTSSSSTGSIVNSVLPMQGSFPDRSLPLIYPIQEDGIPSTRMGVAGPIHNSVLPMQGSLPDRTSFSSSTFAGTDVVPEPESVSSEDDGKPKFLSVSIDAALDIDKLMSPRVTAVHFCATGKSDPGDFICDRAHALLCTDLVASVYIGALYMAPHATFDAQLGARGKSGNDRYGCKGVSVNLASRIRLETLYAVNLSLALESHLLSQTPFVMVIPLLVCTTRVSV